MSTRSLTVLIDGRDGKETCVLYRHCDGYPSGHGAELKNFLTGFEITNGIGERTKKTANGAGCLFAQMVAHFKTEVGQFYLYPPGTRDAWEDYTYYVTAKPGEPIHLKVEGDSVLYDGPVSGFNPEMDEAA
jgi:hypothetical protein